MKREVILLPGQEIKLTGPATIRFVEGNLRSEGNHPTRFTAQLEIVEEPKPEPNQT